MVPVVANVHSATARRALVPRPRPRASGTIQQPTLAWWPSGPKRETAPSSASLSASTMANAAPVREVHIEVDSAMKACASASVYGCGMETQRAISGSWQAAQTAAASSSRHGRRTASPRSRVVSAALSAGPSEVEVVIRPRP